MLLRKNLASFLSQPLDNSSGCHCISLFRRMQCPLVPSSLSGVDDPLLQLMNDWYTFPFQATLGDDDTDDGQNPQPVMIHSMDFELSMFGIGLAELSPWHDFMTWRLLDDDLSGTFPTDDLALYRDSMPLSTRPPQSASGGTNPDVVSPEKIHRKKHRITVDRSQWGSLMTPNINMNTLAVASISSCFVPSTVEVNAGDGKPVARALIVPPQTAARPAPSKQAAQPVTDGENGEVVVGTGATTPRRLKVHGTGNKPSRDRTKKTQSTTLVQSSISASEPEAAITATAIATNACPEDQDPVTRDYISGAISDVDVLMGRGGLTNNHKGNKAFLEHKTRLQAKYLSLSKEEKTAISEELVEWVLERGGRFLKRDKTSGRW
jgi:hypothetical protein